MTRKMVLISIPWLVGLAAASLINSSYDFVLFPAAIISALIIRFVFKAELKRIIVILVSAVTAFTFFRVYTVCVYDSVLKYDGKQISYSGKIIEYKDYSGDRSRYVLSGRINGSRKAKILVYTDTLSCETGDTLSFVGMAQSFENTYLFDSADYYRSEGIYLRADDITELEVDHDTGFSVLRSISEYREHVTAFISKNLSIKESGLLTGMLLGDKSGIAPDTSTLMYRSGIGHVMAVSGLHLVLFCSLISFIIKPFPINSRIKFAVLESAIIFYVIFSGMSISVIRAAIMLTLSYSSALFFRRSDTLNSMCIAAFAMTLHFPYVISSASFILSFSGTFGAGVFAPYFTSRLPAGTFLRWLFKTAVYTFLVSVSVIPASVICFGEISVISPIANIILTPLCMAAISIGFVSAAFMFTGFTEFLIRISGALCKIVLNTTELLGNSSFSYIIVSDNRLHYVALILVLFTVFAALLFRKRKVTAMAAASAFVMLYSLIGINGLYKEKNLYISVMGSESADVLVIAHGGSADIIDISGKSDNYRYAAKYLSDSNITRVNNLVITEKPYQAMSVYTNNFALFDVENVILPYGTYMLEGTKLCGCDPVYSDYSSLDWSYDDYSISVREGTCSLSFGEFSFVLTDSESNAVNAEVLVEYGGVFNAENCGKVILTEGSGYEYCGTNYEICAGNGGRVSIGRL